MKQCSHCKQSPKVLILRQDEAEEKLICAPCIMQQYEGELGWLGKQAVQSIMKKITGE